MCCDLGRIGMPRMGGVQEFCVQGVGSGVQDSVFWNWSLGFRVCSDAIFQFEEQRCSRDIGDDEHVGFGVQGGHDRIQFSLLTHVMDLRRYFKVQGERLLEMRSVSGFGFRFLGVGFRKFKIQFSQFSGSWVGFYYKSRVQDLVFAVFSDLGYVYIM